MLNIYNRLRCCFCDLNSSENEESYDTDQSSEIASEEELQEVAASPRAQFTEPEVQVNPTIRLQVPFHMTTRHRPLRIGDAQQQILLERLNRWMNEPGLIEAVSVFRENFVENVSLYSQSDYIDMRLIVYSDLRLRNLVQFVDLSFLPPLSIFHNCLSLNMSGCHLVEIDRPTIFEDLPHSVTSLNLSRNFLSFIPRFGEHCRIQSLNLSYNNIGRTDLVNLPSSLRRLDLSGNHLNSLPRFGESCCINWLDLNCNTIIDISEDELIALRQSMPGGTINLTNNPLSDQTIARINQFNQTADRQFRIQLDTQRSNIVSQNMAGTTPLLTALLPHFGFTQDQVMQWDNQHPGSAILADMLDNLYDGGVHFGNVNMRHEAFQAKLAEILCYMMDYRDFYKLALNILSDSTQTCQDLLSFRLQQLYQVYESDRIKRGHYDQKAGDCFKLFKGLIRLDLLQEIAARRASQGGDDVEIYLHYQQGLKDPLQLPLMVQDMAYRVASKLNDADLKNAEIEVRATEPLRLKEKIFDLNGESVIVTWLERHSPTGMEKVRDAYIAYFDEETDRFQIRLNRLETLAKTRGAVNFEACDKDIKTVITKTVEADLRIEVFMDLVRSEMPEEVANQIESLCFLGPEPQGYPDHGQVRTAA